jgi:monoamine oxidase
MNNVDVAVVGGGLAGVYAAFLLEKQGVRDYALLEARTTLGGRILSVPATAQVSSAIDRVDLGPTWFWPAYQRQLDRLIAELGIERFAQHEVGDMVVERSAGAAPERARGYTSAPPAMRLVGGMSALVEALYGRLDPSRIVTNAKVRLIRRTEAGVEVECNEAAVWRARHVLLAFPPRLAEDGIAFSPALPAGLGEQWRGTATWMAPHAKYIAVYDRPFWREAGLSGEGRSARGPMAETHDACMPGGCAALFGFLGVPARVRERVPEAVLRSHCRAQLQRMFGPLAAAPTLDVIKDWAFDPETAAPLDLEPATHGQAPDVAASAGPWASCLTGIASEWSPQFPGYVAGAVEAADLGVQRVLAQARHNPVQERTR